MADVHIHITNGDMDAYLKRVKELMDSYAKLEDGAAKKVFDLLDTLRRTLSDELTRVPADASGLWRAAQIRALQRALTTTTTDFSQRYHDVLNAESLKGWAFGESFTPEALRAAGIVVSFPVEVALTQLEIAQTLQADLVTRVDADMKQRIGQQILNGISGEMSPHQIMQNVSNLLRTEPARDDPSLGPLTYQGERIMRAEVGKVFSLSNQLRQAQIVTAVPTLKKWWLAIVDGRTRPDHIAAGERYAVGGSPGPIGFNEKYHVGPDDLDFPRDPNGSPSEIINCRCTNLLYSEEWFSNVDVEEPQEEEG